MQLKDRVAFCNTHKTRGLYREVINASINSIRLSPAALRIEIISSDLNQEDFLFTVEKGFDFEQLGRELELAGIEVIAGR
ncbi:hypothetical protein D3C76_1482220 [compost metagenome]